MNSPARPFRPLAGLVALSLALLCAWSAPAYADDNVEINVVADGTVEGTVVVGASLERVRQYIADTESIRRLSKDVETVTITRDGGCEIVTTFAKSVIDVTYVARRCPTETGWIETLMQSKQFADYYCEWFTKSVAGGTWIKLRMRTAMDLPIPARIVRGTLKRNFKTMFSQIQDHLGEPREDTQVADPSR